MSTVEFASLIAALDAATGRDAEIDCRLRAAFGGDAQARYTASVDDCIALVRRQLPGWSWHVGWSADGVSPYATLHRQEVLLESKAPTVPLALLRVLCRAVASQSAD